MLPENVVGELNQSLDQWLRWFRFRRAIIWAVRGFTLGLAFMLLFSLTVLPRGWLLQVEYLRLIFIIPLGYLILSALSGFWWAFPRLQAARFFDRRFGLQERVSTALELASENNLSSSEELTLRQAADALAAARVVNPRAGLPFHLPRRELLIASILIFSLGLLWIKAPPYFQAALQSRLVNEAIQQETAQVEALLEEIEEMESLTPEQRQSLSEPLQEANQQMQEAQSLEQAVSAMNEAETRMKSMQASQQQNQVQSLQEAGENLSQEEGSPLQKFGQSLASNDLRGASGDLQQIDPGQLSQDEREAFAQQLEETAGTLAGENPELAQQLRSAAEALQNGDLEAARQNLQQASENLKQTGQEFAQSQAAGQAATQLSQSRQRLVQAGNTAQSLAYNGNSSEGQQAGQEMGQGTGQGQSQSGNQSAGSGSGRGESSGESGQSAETGPDPIEQDNGPGDGGERPYERIYAPNRLGGEGGDEVNLPGSGQSGDQVVGQGGTAPGAPGTSSVPYVEVLPAYQESARQAIESGQVPLHLRNLVREYFSSLEQ